LKFFLAAVFTAFICVPDDLQAKNAVGFVFEDINKNRKRDRKEPGIPDVRVSNGKDIVNTDSSGRYEISVGEDTIIFIIKPRGWKSPVNQNQLPQYYYIHKPKGSPELFFKGVSPTGPLPKIINFPLYRTKEPDKFRAIIFGDTQPGTKKAVDYISHDVVADMVGTEASFGITLGDIVFNDLNLLERVNSSIAMLGIPWHYVIGNHDINMDAKTEDHSDETFERVYGPPYYSFDYGPVHFVVIDNVEWIFNKRLENKPAGKDRTPKWGKYRGGLDEEQLQFIENDLAEVPQEKLVVFFMHIPVHSKQWIEPKKQKLFRLMETRKFAISLAAHAHFQQHHFLKKEDGWLGPEHHHIVNVTVCGSWWRGRLDERGIPHTTMRDGAPNGYAYLSFDGHNYEWEYRAAGRPKSYQMRIIAPDEIDLAKSPKFEILVNVFGGSEKSTVEYRIGKEGKWRKMKKVLEKDPVYEVLYLQEKKDPAIKKGVPAPMLSPHMWKAESKAKGPKGAHLLQVRTTDFFGHVYKSNRVIQFR